MKGTLALWYEPVATAGDEQPGAKSHSNGTAPMRRRLERILERFGISSPELDEPPPTEDGDHRVELELHANLWRDLPSGTNFLDLGLMFRRAEHMSRFYLYVPATLSTSCFQDLGGILRSGVTPNAVFNDVVTPGPERDNSYSVSRGSETFIVHKLRESDWELEQLNDPLFGNGTRFVFTEELCVRMAASPDRQYVRFRIRLVDDAATTFSSDLIARDRAFASSAGRLELTEFRLNERRSFPRSFAGRAARGRFKIKVIHYFLIRDLEHQLVVQSAPFEKVRRLESALWGDYVADAYGPVNERSTKKLTERLVIYHWKAKPKRDASEIEDFVAFASFRTTSTSLLYYAFVIVLLGAAGSALAALSGELVGNWLASDAWTPRLSRPSSWSVGVTVWALLLSLFSSAIAFLAYGPVILSGIRRAARWFRSITAPAHGYIARLTDKRAL